MWNESSGPSEDTEANLRADITELEEQRISVGDAYRSIYRGLGLVVIPLGHAPVAWASVAILAAAVGLAVLTGSVLPALVGLVALAGVGMYAESNLEDWVDEHNADVDARIRRRLRHPDEES